MAKTPETAPLIRATRSGPARHSPATAGSRPVAAPSETGGGMTMTTSQPPLDMFFTCDHRTNMSAMIQIRNVPDDLHRRLKARAAMAGMSLSDFLLAQIRESAAVPTPEEMKARLEGREPTRPSISVAEAVRSERDAR